MDLNNIAVLGLARSGIAAAQKIKALGGTPFLSEMKSAEEVPESEKLIKEFNCEFGGHSPKLLEFGTIIVSPGIPQNIPLLHNARKQGIELISEIELGYRIKSGDSQIIAVTGSNGKSTTVSLISEILKKSGYNTLLGGNIGTAFTSLPIEVKGVDFIVLEISSFQLELIHQFHPQVALLLNLTPDHLNRYRNFKHYAETKFRIFLNQSEHDLSIINKNDNIIKNFSFDFHSIVKQFSLSRESDAWFDGERLIIEKYSIPVKDLLLKGPHNYANCLAAILAVSRVDLDKDVLIDSLYGFKPLAHRLEFITSIRGINFINDSKATNTDSVRYALQSFPEPIRIIMGGRGKGEDYSVLNDLIAKHVKKMYLIGESRHEMKKVFENIAPVEMFNDLETAVKSAFEESDQGEYIVLSPACASFDMFTNFEDRGKKFKEIVDKLK